MKHHATKKTSHLLRFPLILIDKRPLETYASPLYMTCTLIQQILNNNI